MTADLLSAEQQSRPAVTGSIRNLPVNLFGAVMGLSGLALGWRLATRSLGFGVQVADALSIFSSLVFLAITVAYLFKLVKHPDAVLAEFRHPIAGNFFGTITISLLLQSAVLGHYFGQVGLVLWIVGTVTTLLVSYVVVSRLLSGGGDPSHAVPAWLIPGVAALDIAVTFAYTDLPGSAETLRVAAGIGTALALVMFTMIVVRLVQREPLAAAMTPSLMILVAPFEVGFLAYTNLTGEVDAFAAMLFYFGLFLFLVLAPKVFRPGIAFGPAWWAISFPLAALVNAALKYASVQSSQPLTWLAWGLLILLTAALSLLTVRTFRIVFNGKLLAN